MKRPIALLSAGLMVFTLSYIGPGVATATAAEDSSSSSKRVRRSATMRPQIFKKLDEARELADAKKYQEAIEELQALEKRRRNSYETAMTHNMYAYVYFGQENYTSAAKAYEDVLAVENIPESLEQTTLYSLAKLYLMQEDYEKSLEPLNKWFGLVAEPGGEAYVLRAQIYFQLEQYNKALPDIKTAIATVKEQGNKPRENWLMLERAVYYQNGDFENLARCLQDLVTLYPKSQYWVQLAAVYAELNQPKRELATLETAYEQDMLEKENQIINYAQALLGQDIPFKSAVILSKGMEDGIVEENARNMSLLGDAWMLAKEYDKAIVAMTRAAELSQEGSDFFKLAQIHTERQEWQLALTNVNQALEQGELSQPSSALILKGLILFNMDRLTDAKGAFAKASEFDEAKKTAKQWMEYIESEEKRREYMASS